jgi:hypothetical protein
MSKSLHLNNQAPINRLAVVMGVCSQRVEVEKYLGKLIVIVQLKMQNAYIFCNIIGNF